MFVSVECGCVDGGFLMLPAVKVFPAISVVIFQLSNTCFSEKDTERLQCLYNHHYYRITDRIKQ